ncbi:triose-phosphate isomerase [Asaia platycodi]|uniref:triose-phosphate isomerase n=1 Tax=Asaia platycodi TaxID=610243 RepID=UPI0034E1CD28
MPLKSLWIGTSWKMNKGPAAARDAAEQIASMAVPSSVTPFVIPPFTSLETVASRLADTRWHVGAQNMHWEDEAPGPARSRLIWCVNVEPISLSSAIQSVVSISARRTLPSISRSRPPYATPCAR